jgi:hypothetical protein
MVSNRTGENILSTYASGDKPKKNGPRPWLPDTQYMPLVAAATALDRTAEEVLHLGVVGELNIMAPVMREGVYIWQPQEVFNLPVSPTLKSYVEVNFGPEDLIFLDRGTLAIIERKGWALPRVFFSPEKAREQFAKWQAEHPSEGGELCRPADIPMNFLNDVRWLKVQLGQLAKFKSEQSAAELHQEQERYFLAPWRPVVEENKFLIEKAGDSYVVAEDVPDDQRTTVKTLYVSVGEILRLREIEQASQLESVAGREPRGQQLAEKEVLNRYAERHAKRREDAWLAALVCLYAWPTKCGESAQAWAEKVAIEQRLFEGLSDTLLGKGTLRQKLSTIREMAEALKQGKTVSLEHAKAGAKPKAAAK